MFRNKKNLVTIAMIIMLSLSACNLPARVTPPPFSLPTPDLTLTAVFSVLSSFTPSPPLVQTATGEALPTSTPASTDTPVPSKTVPQSPAFTSTPTRPGPIVSASFLSSAPVIDGNLGEWTSTKYNAKDAVYGADKIKGEADLSATFMVGWDNSYLYIAAQVVDDHYVQGAKGENLYKGDSLEILFDADLNADYYVNSLSRDDHQVGISPGSSPGSNMEAYLWYPRAKESKLNSVSIAAKPASDGYIVEVAIPWSVFGITPGTGQVYGFAFSVSDNDQAGAAIQESMVSNTATRGLTRPMTWGVLTLLGGK